MLVMRNSPAGRKWYMMSRFIVMDDEYVCTDEMYLVPIPQGINP